MLKLKKLFCLKNSLYIPIYVTDFLIVTSPRQQHAHMRPKIIYTVEPHELFARKRIFFTEHVERIPNARAVFQMRFGRQKNRVALFRFLRKTVAKNNYMFGYAEIFRNLPKGLPAPDEI